MHFYENPITCQCEKESKRLKGFKMLHCYWSPSRDVVAVEGLIVLLKCHRNGNSRPWRSLVSGLNSTKMSSKMITCNTVYYQNRRRLPDVIAYTPKKHTYASISERTKAWTKSREESFERESIIISKELHNKNLNQYPTNCITNIWNQND